VATSVTAGIVALAAAWANFGPRSVAPVAGRTVSTGFTPPGHEYPLSDLGEPTNGPQSLTLASLARVTQVPGHPADITGPTMMYAGCATAVEMQCDWDTGGGGACHPEWNWSVPRTTGTSSVENMTADCDVWIWSNVPHAASVVGFTQGSTKLWQHPVNGVVQFRASVASKAGDVGVPVEAVAYDTSGAEVARADDQMILAASAAVIDPNLLQADATQAQREDLANLTDTTIRACLIRAGATTISVTVLACQTPRRGSSRGRSASTKPSVPSMRLSQH
jgi:hypothetical protein